MKKKKLPVFKSEDEEAKFWGTHSLADYIHEFEPVDELFRSCLPTLAHKIRERAKRRLVSIRLAHWEIEKSKEIAKRRKMPYQTSLRGNGLMPDFAPPSPALPAR